VTRVTRASFIVRVVRDRRGTGCGVIERVATGAKEAFPGVEAIGPVIARMGGAGGGRPTVEQHGRQPAAHHNACGRFIVVPLTGRRGRLHGRPVNEPAPRYHD
jgi:hypothetical protein